MDKQAQQFLHNSNYCISQLQNTQFVLLINFDKIWHEQREWAFEIIKNFTEFKK